MKRLMLILVFVMLCGLPFAFADHHKSGDACNCKASCTECADNENGECECDDCQCEHCDDGDTCTCKESCSDCADNEKGECTCDDCECDHCDQNKDKEKTE